MYLVSTLQEQLYTHLYCRGYAAPLRWEARQPQGISPLSSILQTLADANASRGYWSSAWVVRRIEGAHIIASQDGVHLRVGPAHFLAEKDASILPGTTVSLRFPKELPELSPGFYMATSNTELTQEDWKQLVRVYWNVTAKGAIGLVRGITSELNRAGLPFRLKVLKDLTYSTRCDVGVLYIRKTDYKAISNFLEGLYQTLADNLRQETPVFTMTLAPGVGLAEDPLNGSSFGLNRCLLLAEGMVGAYETGKRTVDQTIGCIENCFARAGVDWERPHLNPGSKELYPFMPKRGRPHTHRDDTLDIPDVGSDAWLRTAHALGRHLCGVAVWHQERCNWIGVSTGDPTGRTYSNLGPDLYAGTSGIGMFLAELYAATGDPIVQRTALGAIRQALACQGSVPCSSRIGLFTGLTGIALVCARMGVLWQDGELLDAADDLLICAAREHRFGRDLDLISGNAGAITAILALRDTLTDRHLDFAAKLGTELIHAAVQSKDCCSWRTINAANEYHLTGLSHGTAGIALALLELFDATGETQYRCTAERAFAYERHWFDPAVGNWPDLREASARRPARRQGTFSTYWCHGAPGIALSRLRAYEILGNPHYRGEALAAMATTREMIQSGLRSRSVNFSLCHGLAGNADILLTGSRMLSDDLPADSSIATSTANAGIAMHSSAVQNWPCGAGNGSTPGLMLGLAGIGYFYLRVHTPSIPSVLILRESGAVDA